MGAPAGAEAASDLPVSGGVTEIALGSVVIGGHLTAAGEGEGGLAEQAVTLSQPQAVAVGGSERHDGIEVAFEAATVFAAGAFGQAAMAAGQHDGAQQERLHAWGEDGIACLDGVAAVAQLMRQ